jgi:hypothetical protein
MAFAVASGSFSSQTLERGKRVDRGKGRWNRLFFFGFFVFVFPLFGFGFVISQFAE